MLWQSIIDGKRIQSWSLNFHWAIFRLGAILKVLVCIVVDIAYLLLLLLLLRKLTKVVVIMSATLHFALLIVIVIVVGLLNPCVRVHKKSRDDFDVEWAGQISGVGYGRRLWKWVREALLELNVVGKVSCGGDFVPVLCGSRGVKLSWG